MAQNEKKRQKKLERRAAKRKERVRELVVQKNRGLAELLRDAAAAPILDCFITETFLSEGMGQLLVSRQLSHGRVAAAVFLVDRYCLGVKNAFGRIADMGQYRQLLAGLKRQDDVIPLAPEDARRLIDDAVAYAADLGLSPHPDYHRAKPIFGDIDAHRATRTFEFGRDGQPFYIQGPHDSPQFGRMVVETLRENCGEGNFHFMLAVGGAELALLGDANPLRLESSDEDDEDDFDKL